jgi:hypothetical protein
MLPHHAVVFSDIDGCRNSRQYQEFQSKIVIVLCAMHAIRHIAPLHYEYGISILSESVINLLGMRRSQGLVAIARTLSPSLRRAGDHAKTFGGLQRRVFR